MAYANLFGEIGLVSAAYSRKWEPLGNFWGGIRHFTYGQFQEINENGIETGTFGINGTDLTVGASRAYGRFRYGANFRLLQHTVYRSTSTAFAFDFGGTYYNPKSQTGVGAAITNIGYNISKYDATAGTHELPFDITVGVSQKLANAPFRLTLTLHQLNRLRMVHEDPEAEQEFDLAGNPIDEGTNTTEDIFRHMNLGLEILFSPNFQLRAGYSHQRRQELRAPEAGLTLDGFSMGASIRISKLYLDYSYAGFHAVGGMHHIQASVFLSKFGKSKAKSTPKPVPKPGENDAAAPME